MGYDMHTQGAHGCTDPTHDDHYLQRALGNGVVLARQLLAAGMGTWADDEAYAAAEAAGFPEKPDTIQWDDGLDDYIGADVEQWRERVDGHLKDRRGAGDGIALYKLCNTNDGWWVTKEECQEAMSAWKDAGCPEFARTDVLPFIRAGADHDGFRVY